MKLKFSCFHEEEFKVYEMELIAQNLELYSHHYRCPVCDREIIVEIENCDREIIVEIEKEEVKNK